MIDKTQPPAATEVTAGGLSESGEGGIRTPGEVTPTQHFQCCTIGRSATSPKRVEISNSVGKNSLLGRGFSFALQSGDFGVVRFDFADLSQAGSDLAGVAFQLAILGVVLEVRFGLAGGG